MVLLMSSDVWIALSTTATNSYHTTPHPPSAYMCTTLTRLSAAAADVLDGVGDELGGAVVRRRAGLAVGVRAEHGGERVDAVQVVLELRDQLLLLLHRATQRLVLLLQAVVATCKSACACVRGGVRSCCIPTSHHLLTGTHTRTLGVSV